MTRYLDIIRLYQRGGQDRPPGTGAKPSGPRREDAAGAARSADAGRNEPGGERALRVEDVLTEIGRPGSGPAKALGTYLEKPNAERLGWLTKAVLRSRAMDTDGWERYVPVVKEAATKAGDERAEGRKEAQVDYEGRTRDHPTKPEQEKSSRRSNPPQADRAERSRDDHGNPASA